ncbi:MAG: response regulator transcription factor [Lachnospiraceae bacterium]|nr:response regulator transcription factor [Lachnospiraceae bacterium]
MSYTVLLVEDNPHIMEINYEALMMEDYHVLKAYDGKSCIEQLEAEDIDLVVLDIMLPDSDGITLCKKIREEYDVPILFLSALGENDDIIRALRAGGDDYMTKPYDLGVFVAHVEARLRGANTGNRCVFYEDIKLDTVSGVASYRGDDMLLTKKEFSLLLMLVTGSGQPIAKEDLYRNVWNSPSATNSSAIYTAISRLNRKLEEHGTPYTVAYNANEGYSLERA